MANIITELHLEMSANWYVSKKLNSIGRVGENTVTKLIIEPTEILDNVTYEIEIADASGSKNVAELTVDGTELYLILTANMLITSGITKMQVRGLFTDGSIKKSNIFELKVNRSISATEHYEEYAVTVFDQLVAECRDIIEGAESYVVRAETAATNAEAYEQSASASAEAASASASTASTASTAAVNAAASAETSANTASTSAETATTAANSASASATSAASSAANAATSETNASTSASNAATSETNAAASASSASTSAANANTSATNAANSATSATTSATNAHNSEVNASTSETNASASATEAAEAAETVASSVAQINENTYRINDLEAIIAGYQLTDLPTGAVANITDGTALLMPSLKIGIEPVQSGSGDPSPENIRPISGWIAANVTRSGKNLFDTPTATSSGTVSIFIKKPVSLKAGIYTLSFKTATSIQNTQTISFYSGDDIIKTYGIIAGVTNITIILPTDCDSLTWYVREAVSLYDIQIEKGSTATTYEPYTGATYNIQFTDGTNPLTVYGGTLDVVSGELAVTDAYIASYDSEILPSTWISDRDVYAEGTAPTTGAEVVYKLANSVTYSLTPTQIRTLVGTNNIWADTGDIIEGKYYRSLT